MDRRKHLEGRRGRLLLFAFAPAAVVAGLGCEALVGVDFDDVPLPADDAGLIPSIPSSPHEGGMAAGSDAAVKPGDEAAALRLAAGRYSSCAITPHGIVKCWGDGSSIPTAVGGLSEGVVSVVAGDYAKCALTASRVPTCWGRIVVPSSVGAGEQQRWASETPVALPGLATGVRSLALSGTHLCALPLSGGAKCWGAGNDGQLGQTPPIDWSDSALDVPFVTRATAIAAARRRSCAIVDANGHTRPSCWGQAAGSEVVTSLVDVKAITTSSEHSCVLTAAGGVKCWGSNKLGAAGGPSGNGQVANVPIDVKGLAAGVVAISAGQDHTCALTAAGTVKCWGSAWNGRLGAVLDPKRSSGLNTYEPLDVVGLESVVAIAAGMNHTCALTARSTIHCWGRNDVGQLGANAIAESSVPVEVLGFP